MVSTGHGRSRHGPLLRCGVGTATAVMATAPECVAIALEAPAGTLGGGSERRPHRQPLGVRAGGQVEEQRAARRLVHPLTLANASQVGPSPGSVSQASAIRSASAGARG